MSRIVVHTVYGRMDRIRTKLSGRKLKVCAIFLSLLLLAVIVGVVTWSVTSRGSSLTKRIHTKIYLTSGGHNITLDKVASQLSYTQEGTTKAVVYLGANLKTRVLKDCEADGTKDVCLVASDGSVFRTDLETQTNVTCHNISWQSPRADLDLITDCFDLAYGHWYGGCQMQEHYWPVERLSHKMDAYVAGDSYVDQYGGVIERYWLSSAGVGVYVPASVPLFVSINETGDQRLCLGARYSSPYRRTSAQYDPKYGILNYTLCYGRDVKDVHYLMSSRFIPKPTDIPDLQMFKFPIWSTWARYKKDINQTTVIQYAEEIKRHGFNHSQLEIDDDWTPKYGDLSFNKNKFPNPKYMVQRLKFNGFRTTLWVHPWINTDSAAFSQENFQYFLKVPGLDYPVFKSWWDGKLAAILDVTNPKAVTWFLGNLKRLQNEVGISSFKFDGGETNWLPEVYRSLRDHSNPELYTSLWAKLAFEADRETRHQEVRVGVHSQSLPIFVRMLDKDSKWGWVNGLKTLIPDALTFGLIGYPFVLPDMIGGNAYGGSLTGKAYPQRELFIRWLQTSLFMPSLQFSIVPWQYDNETVRICQDMLTLRAEFTDYIIELARHSTVTGHPIVRPLWWLDPSDPVALTIDSEYLVGKDLLVAPVLVEGATSRDVYIPSGRWRDGLTRDVLAGGRWYRDHEARLDQLPYFTRLV